MSVEMSRYGPDYHCVTISRDVFEVRSHYVNLRPVGGGSYGIVCSAEDTVWRIHLHLCGMYRMGWECCKLGIDHMPPFLF